MRTPHFRRATTMVAFALLWAGPHPSEADAQSAAPPDHPRTAGDPWGQEPLTLHRVQVMAVERNQRLAAMRASARAVSLRRPEASTLPDPTLQLGVMNLGLPSLAADMPSSMAPSVQFMQMVPFPGKLSLKGRIAALDEERAAAVAEEMAWETREMAAAMFYGLYAFDRRVEVMEETLALLGNFGTVARAMYAAGTGRQADVLRADVEVARMDADIRAMRAMRAAMAARLVALLDLPAGTEVPTPVLDRLPAETPPADTLLAWADASRPLLEEGRHGVEQARSQVALARREIWPDLTIGVAYGQRGAEMGTERMGSAMVGFSLPIFASRRQHAMRDEALAMERMAQADLGSRSAEVGARVGELLAELQRARSLARLYREEVLPQARATVASALSSYRVGSVDFMTLIDAQMAVNGFEGDLYQLVADYGSALSALEAAVGRILPDSPETMAVIR